MDIDIFERTCICHPHSDLKEGEVEIFDAESAERLGEEEAAVFEEEQEKLDPKMLQRELECMKRRIQKLQLMLKAQLDECPEEPCVDFEVELTCSENKQICALQKAQHRLQCQIDELTRCCKAASVRIREMSDHICEKSRQVRELQKAVASLNSWRLTLNKEFGVCIERFEYLKTVKAEWDAVVEMFEKEKACYAKMEDKYVPKTCYVEDKLEFAERLHALKGFCESLFEFLTRRSESLGEEEDDCSKMSSTDCFKIKQADKQDGKP